MRAGEIGLDGSTGRRLFTLEIPDFASWPTSFGIDAENFALLVVADSRGVSDESIQAAAQRAIEDGASYVCAWGPECGRIESAFDHVAAPRSAAGAPVVMTTAHANETLNEAVWFLLALSHPDEAYAARTTASVAVVVRNPGWAAQVVQAFMAPRAFAKTVVNGSAS